MDDRRFDGLTRALAGGASRRSVIKALLGLGGAAALAPLAQSGEADAARRPTAGPTPIPSCPGIQVWSNGQCGCPSGVTCGPTCCQTAAQCCDGACCPTGSICTGEEVCCPLSQMCGGACCGAAQTCCDVDGCCDGVCVSSGTCCTTGNVCSAANGDACCAPGQDCCSSGDPICIDRSAGGCCLDSDCANLTDACNVGICDPSTNLCIARPVADGTSCGDCATCQSGSCATCDSPFECCHDSVCVDPAHRGCCDDAECFYLTNECNTGICDPASHHCVAQPVADGTSCGACVTCTGGVCSDPCDSPLLCCEQVVCVDPASGGCCTDTDCPTSTDACVTYHCSNHECVEVPVITCPSGEECLDGECVCAGGQGPCGDGDDAACCPAGEICNEVTLPSGTTWLCCPEDAPACIDIATESVVCCSDGCQQFDVGNGNTIGICCAGEVCPGARGLTCCPSGQTCSELDLDGFSVGICCDGGNAACFDGTKLICCDAGETCTLDLEVSGRGICCATEVCEDVNENQICCAPGSTCQPLTMGGNPHTICCAGEPCLDGDVPICCDAGERCRSIDIQGQTLHMCCAGEVCVSLNGPICCAAGETCQAIDTPNSIPLGVCCAPGIDACFGPVDGAVCCGQEGFSCQPLEVVGFTAQVCCDGPPCAVGRDIVCCAPDEICDSEDGCVAAP